MLSKAYCANAAGESGPGENGWVSLEEWEAMPEGLKPLMAHRCHALGWDVTQQGVRDRGACWQAQFYSFLSPGHCLNSAPQTAYSKCCCCNAPSNKHISLTIRVFTVCLDTGCCHMSIWVVIIAEAARQRNAYGFDRVGEPELERANGHILVRVAKL